MTALLASPLFRQLAAGLVVVLLLMGLGFCTAQKFDGAKITKLQTIQATQAAQIRLDGQIQVIQAHFDDQQRETANVVSQASLAILSLPHAADEIDPGVAHAWADGIDRLRNRTPLANG